MEVVTVKFQEDVLKKIDESIAKNNFNSRTEFIREAVRDKLGELERDNLIKQVMSMRGSLKPKNSLSDEEIRENAGERMKRILDKRFGLK